MTNDLLSGVGDGPFPHAAISAALGREETQFEVVPGSELRQAGSLTWACLRNTYFWIDPKRGIGGAIFVQMLPFANPKVLALYYRVERTANAAIRT